MGDLITMGNNIKVHGYNPSQMGEGLVKINNGQIVTSSRQIAEAFGKQHRHVLRDIRDMLGGLPKIGHTPPMFYESSYINEQNGQSYPEYLMNRDGFSLLVMGFTGKAAMEWKLRYISAFNQMEAELNRINNNLPDFSNPVEAARAWADEAEKNQKLIAQLEEAKPKLAFYDAVDKSINDISIGTLAKILRQNGINIGRNRMFEWLRDNDYLIKSGVDKNRPMQVWVDKGFFRVKEWHAVSDDGTVTRFTTYVTGKGQTYFVNKFLDERKMQKCLS